MFCLGKCEKLDSYLYNEANPWKTEFEHFSCPRGYTEHSQRFFILFEIYTFYIYMTISKKDNTFPINLSDFFFFNSLAMTDPPASSPVIFPCSL